LDRSEQEILDDTLKYAVSEVVKKLLADHELCQSQICVDTGFDVYNRQQSETETPGPSCIVSDLEVDSAFPSITCGGTVSTSGITPLEGEPLSLSFNSSPICKDGFSASLHLPQSTDCDNCQTRRYGISLKRTIPNFSLRPPTSKSPATQTTMLPSTPLLPGDLMSWAAEKAGAGAHRNGSHSAFSYDDPGFPYSLDHRSMFGTDDYWS
jgi:hypothetical protein